MGSSRPRHRLVGSPLRCGWFVAGKCQGEPQGKFAQGPIKDAKSLIGVKRRSIEVVCAAIWVLIKRYGNASTPGPPGGNSGLSWCQIVRRPIPRRLLPTRSNVSQPSWCSLAWSLPGVSRIISEALGGSPLKQRLPRSVDANGGLARRCAVRTGTGRLRCIFVHKDLRILVVGVYQRHKRAVVAVRPSSECSGVGWPSPVEPPWHGDDAWRQIPPSSGRTRRSHGGCVELP